MIKNTQSIAQDYIFPHVKDARSVSSLVSAIQKPFDPTGSKLRKTARNKGLTTEEVQAKWSAKAVASRKLGSDLHEHIASILRQETPDPIETLSTQHSEIRVFNRFWNRSRAVFKVIWVEQTITSQRYNISGRVDALLYHSESGYHLVDWKTGKYSSHGWDSLFAPFADLRSSSPVLGAFQLGIYRLAVEDALGIELGRSYVGYVSDHSMTMRRVPDIRDRLSRWLLNG